MKLQFLLFYFLIKYLKDPLYHLEIIFFPPLNKLLNFGNSLYCSVNLSSETFSTVKILMSKLPRVLRSGVRDSWAVNVLRFNQTKQTSQVSLQ